MTGKLCPNSLLKYIKPKREYYEISSSSERIRLCNQFRFLTKFIKCVWLCLTVIRWWFNKSIRDMMLLLTWIKCFLWWKNIYSRAVLKCFAANPVSTFVNASLNSCLRLFIGEGKLATSVSGMPQYLNFPKLF